MQTSDPAAQLFDSLIAQLRAQKPNDASEIDHYTGLALTHAETARAVYRAHVEPAPDAAPAPHAGSGVDTDGTGPDVAPEDEPDPLDAPADVVITVDRAFSPIARPAWIGPIGLSHVDRTLSPNTDQPDIAARNRARELIAPVIGFHLTHIHAFGLPALAPTPDSAFNWAPLDAQIETLRNLAAPAGAQIGVILHGFPYWMRGEFDGETTRPLTAIDQFSPKGRILTDFFADHDALIEAVAQRYAHIVDLWIYGQEGKGYYMRRDGKPHLWDGGAYPGTPGEADHGFAYAYNRAVSAIERGLTSAGRPPGEVMIGGPYAAVRTQSSAGAGTIPAGARHLAPAPYGHWRLNAPAFIEEWESHADRFDFVCWDIGSANADGIDLVDPWTAADKIGDFAAAVASITNKWQLITEFYAKTYDDDNGHPDRVAAYKATCYQRMIRAGIAGAALWSPIGLGEPNPPAGGLISGTTSIHDPQISPWLTAARKIAEMFKAPGRPVFLPDVSDPARVEALASTGQIHVINKTAETLDIDANGQRLTLWPYDQRIVSA